MKIPMSQREYRQMEAHVRRVLSGDAAHDLEHVYRVLGNATHRFRGGNPPKSLEAKILFDADKLDVCGALGVARTLMYQGHHRQPLYETRDGHILQTGGDCFVNEYNRKLRRLYGGFLTQEGARLAAGRKRAAEAYYQALMEEVEFGREGLNRLELEN